jgi:hypothetical protein
MGACLQVPFSTAIEMRGSIMVRLHDMIATGIVPAMSDTTNYVTPVILAVVGIAIVIIAVVLLRHNRGA